APVSTCFGQENTPVKNSWSFGIEGGWGWHFQSGSFGTNCTCHLPYEDGKGNGPAGSLFFETQLSDIISIGMKAGVDYKYISEGLSAADTMTITYGRSDSVATGYFILLHTATVSETFLFFSPYMKIAIFRKLFLSIAPEIGILTNSRFTST